MVCSRRRPRVLPWDADKSDLSVQTNMLHPTFPSSASPSDPFSVSHAGYTLTYSMDGASAAKRVAAAKSNALASNETVYRGVQAGVDLTYAVNPSSVKESVILNSVPTQGSFSWHMNAPGLTGSITDRGDVAFVDKDGTTQFSIPAPVMWDSRPQSDGNMVMVPFTFAQSGDGWVMTLTPSRDWLTDPARVFPVTIDPSWWSGSSMFAMTAFKNDGVSYSDGAVRMGNPADGTPTHEWRTVACYTYAPLFGYQVLAADLAAGNLHTGNTTARTGGVYDATAFGFSAVGAYRSAWTITGSGDATDTSLSQAVGSWVQSQAAGSCLMLVGQESVGVYTYKQPDTHLYIYYKAMPTVSVVAPSPTGGVKAAAYPTFKLSATDPEGTGLAYRYVVSTSSNPLGDPNPVYNSGWTGANPLTLPRSIHLTAGATYYWAAQTRDMYDGAYGNAGANPAATSSTVNTPVNSFIANAPPVLVQGGETPSDNSVIVTPTPTLTIPVQATDDTVAQSALVYQFRVATGADGSSGIVATSDPITAPSSSTAPVSWSVPAGVLQDGSAYTWVVLVKDDFDNYYSWVDHFKFTSRTGAPGPSPSDNAGPVTVNLANGNASVHFTSPTVNTVGGPMGLAFAYNSQRPSNQGLVGTYYNVGVDPLANYVFPPTGGTPNPVMVRTDSALRFNWGTTAPGPGVKPTQFEAEWKGFVTPPANGSFTFAFVRDNGARLYLGTSATPVIDQWTIDTTTSATYGATPNLTTGPSGTYNPTPIKVDYFNQQGPGNFELWVKGTFTDGTPAMNGPVPASWFTKSVDTLPPGWSSTAPILGDSTPYVSAQVQEGSVIVTDSDGTTYTYTKSLGTNGLPSPNGGYTPPAGDDSLLTVDTTGAVSLTEDDGTLYQFNAAGKILSVTSTLDPANHPTTPLATYRSANGRLDAINDPLSGSAGSYARKIQFAYSDDTAASVGLSASDTDATGKACVVPSGLDPAPAGMVCRIIYPGHVPTNTVSGNLDDTTQLFYKNFAPTAGGATSDPTSGGTQLMRIIDPGAEQTDFGYTGGLLSSIRSPLANDWIAAGHSGATATTTDIVYTGNKVQSVTLPAPDGVASTTTQPQKTYNYVIVNPDGSGSTTVDARGQAAHRLGQLRYLLEADVGVQRDRVADQHRVEQP